MVSDGFLSQEQREAALNHIQAFGDRAEEALLEANLVQEGELLRYLANAYQTRFVSTDKLAKADIDRATLEKVPKKLAVAHAVFPVLYEPNAGVLSVVTADPNNQVAIDEIRLVSRVREVRAFVARPRAVKAAVAKAYSGDIHAFANLDRAAHAQFTNMLDVYERNLVSDESMVVSLAREDGKERVLSGEELETSNKAGRVSTDRAYVETLNVLVSLLENSRQDLRGHSAQVARLIRKLAERIGLSASQFASLQVAAFVHDLGKMGAYHLTALNVAEYEGHAAQAKKVVSMPLRLMEAVGLTHDTRAAVEQMYERFDGTGFPAGLRGKDISLGGRILAIADTYADLTQNPRNPFRKRLRPAEACEVLIRYKDTIFDPNLVDLFKHSVTGEDLKARLLANRHSAVIVDPDPEETTVLELRMIEQGFEVQQARSIEQALKILQAGECEMVVSEVELGGGGGDGFSLLAEARKHDWGKKLPWIFVTSRTASADARRAFELGAQDFMTKPVAADLLVAKLKQIMEREAVQGGTNRGVSGSLGEMGLPDMVQVLWHGRKTGSLKIRSQSDRGEIHFVSGQIYNAMWGNLRGEEAFYAMLRLTEGTFALDPNAKAEAQVIQANPEALLLEGMRRLDEDAR